MGISIEDELLLAKSAAKRVQKEARIVVQNISRTLERVQNQKNVQSQEDTTTNGTDRH